MSDAPSPSPSPPGQLAASLAEADTRSLVYVDRRGQVRSPATYKGVMARYYAGAGLCLAGANAVLLAMFGPMGLAGGLVVSALVGRLLVANARLRRASLQLAAGDVGGAEQLLRRVRGGALLPPVYRGLAEQGLARAAALQGRFGEALALQESAITRLDGRAATRSQRRMLEYARVATLVNLERAGEARRLLDGLPRALEGDFLRFQRATVELYVAFAEGRHALPASYLREQGDVALATPIGRALLGLVAWAHDAAGARAESARLLAAARERDGEELVRALYPKLAAWMDAQPAGALSPPDR